MIRLYYVKGISRFDTPVFDSDNDQFYFFFDREIYRLAEGYYVPHFKDTIQLDINNDVDFTKSINYLSINFNNKEYYYFIDKVNYVNEGLLELVITMDVIQTYMFNIGFISSKLLRSSINRWTSSTNINRKYIRENYASGSETLLKNETIWDLKSDVFNIALIRFTDGAQFRGVTYVTNPGPDTVNLNTLQGAAIYGPEGVSVDGQAFMLFVFPNKVNTSINISNGPNSGETRTITLSQSGEVSTILRALQEIPFVSSIHILPGSFITRIISGAVVSSNNIDLSATDFRIAKLENQVDIGGSMQWSLYTENVIIYKPYTEIARNITTTVKSIALGYTRNSSKTKAFTYLHVPALLDENYYNIKVGELGCHTGYPLHMATKSTIYARLMYNWVDNVRAYSVVDTNATTLAADKYQTLVHYASLENLDLFTDAYLEYISRNYSSLTRGVALAKQQNLYGTIMSSVSNVFGTATSAGKYSILSDVAGVKGELGSFGVKASVAQGISKQAITMMDYFQQDYVIDEQIGIKLDNVAFTPDQERTGNACNTDIIDGALRGFIWISVDEKLTEIAKIYESFGYAVSNVTTDNILFSHNRYYYDIIQATNIDLYLSNIINDEETLGHIKTRFESGLRLWHTYSDAGGHIIPTISERGLEIGAVCVYDNVEYSLVS